MDHLPVTELTDADLARAWAAGDERGYEAIVSRYAPLVFNRCRRALGAADADDATQAVFLVLAQRRDQAAACPALAAWLMTVAGNVVRNARRDQDRRNRAETSVPPPPPAAEEAAMPGFEEHLDACLAELPEAEREAVTLHYLAGRSLAEVAQQTNAGLSTVKDRLNRGLGRLRTQLAGRGVTLSAAALLTCLQAEAQAAVPAVVMIHLRDLTSAGGGAGSTAALSDRVVRWSRSERSRMSRLAIAASSMLLIGGAATAYVLCGGGDPSTPPPMVTIPTVTNAVADPVAVRAFDLDPEHASGWMTLRWNNGARTIERLRKVPEMALLPPGSEQVLDAVASMREWALVIDTGCMLINKEERIKSYRNERKIQQAQTIAERIRSISAAQQETIEQEGQAIEKHQQALTDKTPEDEAPASRGLAPYMNGLLSFSSVDAPGLGRVRDRLNSGTVLGNTMFNSAITSTKLAEGEWALGSGAVKSSMRLTGSRFELRGQNPALLAKAEHAVAPMADLEATVFMDPGIPGSAPWSTMSMNLTVTEAGIRFASVMNDHYPVTDAIPYPRLDLKRLAAVPAQALVVAGFVMRPTATSQTMMLQHIRPVQVIPLLYRSDPAKAAKAKLTTQRILEAVQQIDGNVVGWIEAGVPLPTFTAEIDMPQVAADEIIALTEEPRAADGSVTTYAGMIAITFGYQQGRLVITTNPAGLASINHSGGFTNQADIKKAIAAMPTKEPQFCVLMRPVALVKTINPFAGMAEPEWQKRLTDYQQRLETTEAYAFFSVDTDAKTGDVHMDASGLLSLIAAGILGGKATAPHNAN